MSKTQTREEIVAETEALIATVERQRSARVSPQAPAPAPRPKITITPKRKRTANEQYKNANPGDLAIANLFIYDLWWDRLPEDERIRLYCNGPIFQRKFDEYLAGLPEPARRSILRVISK